jgi:hypothetical protein
METKKLSQLTLDQETVRNITHNDQPRNMLGTHNCQPTFGFPVCTPVRGGN